MTRGFVRLLVGLTVGIAVVTVLCGCGHQAADRNAAAEQAIRALHTGIAEWTVDHDDGAPAARLVVEATTVPRFDGYPPETVGCYMTSRDPHPWLTNPFTGKPIRQGTSPGDFTYVELADGGNGFTCSAYRLTLYGADSKPLLVEGDDENAWDGAFPTEMTEVNWLIRDWARHHHGVYPPESMVDQAGLGVQYARTVMVGTHVVTFVWPTNPFDGRPLRPGGGPGDYRYRRLGSRRYELIAHDRYGSATRVTQSQSSYWP